MDNSAASPSPGDFSSSIPPPASASGARSAQPPNLPSSIAPQNPSPSPAAHIVHGDDNKKPHATTDPVANPTTSSAHHPQQDADRSTSTSSTTITTAGVTDTTVAATVTPSTLVNVDAPAVAADPDHPVWPPAPSSLPILPPRPPPPHIRTPSAAGLSIQTNNLPPHPPLPQSATGGLQSPLTPTIVEGNVGDSLRQSASVPIAIQDGYLRGGLSATSMAGSLSPGSALSSPALNALADITPLPSPLVMSDSPGPWARAGMSIRPRSRGASNSSRDDSFAMLNKGNLSPSPSLKKKGYQRLQTAAVEAAAAGYHTQQKNESANRERNRSVSEFSPESLHNVRPRHVTISNLAPEQVGPDTSAEPHQQHDLHREQYLAAQRGLVPSASSSSVPVGLPTPPGSNRSVTESEEEEVPEDDKIQYIKVKHGSNKKLWRPVRQLGQGTFSKVYLATSEKTAAKDPLDENTLDPRKLVAIKVVEHGPAGGADEERVELSLKREVEMLRSVSHPSLVHLRAFDKDEAQALLVLTYCPGGDLFDVASTHRNVLSVNLVQRIFAEMVSAVRYLHNQLIVHRDIKLENVLLNVPISTVPLLKDPQSHPYPIATLTDLGLSRRIPAPPESPLLTTRCGSEDYAAPEILLGQPYDGRSTDAWALGVLLYALMEGRLPFDPPPGKVGSRSRAAHRIARCDWVWVKFGDDDGEWDAEKGKEWAGARECVESLLKKVSRGRKSLDDIEKLEWVQKGIQVEGGIKRRIEDEDEELTIPEITVR